LLTNHIPDGNMVYKMRNKEVVMSVTEKMMEAIEEVLDDREREAILSVLDSADEIDFNDFWRSKNYKVVGEKGLTHYRGGKNYKPFKLDFAPLNNGTTYYRIKSAMEKLEKSPKLRAINAFSS
jgi:hypothetical protein